MINLPIQIHVHVYHIYAHYNCVCNLHTTHAYVHLYNSELHMYIRIHIHIMQGLNFAIAIASENSKYFSLDTCYTHIYLMLEDIFPQSPGHIFCKYDQSTSQFWSIMMPSSWHSCQWLEMETSLVLAFLQIKISGYISFYNEILYMKNFCSVNFRAVSVTPTLL